MMCNCDQCAQRFIYDGYASGTGEQHIETRRQWRRLKLQKAEIRLKRSVRELLNALRGYLHLVIEQ